MDEHLTSAGRHALRTKITWDEFLAKIRNNPKYAYRATEWYKAGADLEALKHPAPAPPPAPTPIIARAQYVLFAAQEPLKALAAPTKYAVALSADLAYRDASIAAVKPLRNSGRRVCGWCDCRVVGGTPASAGAEFTQALGLDYFIGQAESAAEFDNAMTVNATVVVGNITALTEKQIAILRLGLVGFIQEDYWNEGWARADDPAIDAYCAGIYPTALWNPTIAQYQQAGRWRDGDGLYHVAAVEDWQNLP